MSKPCKASRSGLKQTAILTLAQDGKQLAVPVSCSFFNICYIFYIIYYLSLYIYILYFIFYIIFLEYF